MGSSSSRFFCWLPLLLKMAGDFGDVDRFIAQLMECKPLSEQEVKALCDKVRVSLYFCSHATAILNCPSHTGT